MPKKARLFCPASLWYIYIYIELNLQEIYLIAKESLRPICFLANQVMTSSVARICTIYQLVNPPPSKVPISNCLRYCLVKKNFSSEFKCTIWNIIFFYFLFQSLRNERIKWGDVGKEFKERKREDKLFHKPCCLFLENHQQTKYLVIHFDNGQSKNW